MKKRLQDWHSRVHRPQFVPQHHHFITFPLFMKMSSTMILVKGMISCLHPCRSVMPQEVKIPDMDGMEPEWPQVRWKFDLISSPGNIVIELKTFSAEVAALNIPGGHEFYTLSRIISTIHDLLISGLMMMMMMTNTSQPDLIHSPSRGRKVDLSNHEM